MLSAKVMANLKVQKMQLYIRRLYSSEKVGVWLVIKKIQVLFEVLKMKYRIIEALK